MRRSMMRGAYANHIWKRRPVGFFHTEKSILLMNSAKIHSGHKVEHPFSGVNCSLNIIHGILTPLLQFIDTHVNTAKHDAHVNRWEGWIEKARSEFTEKGFARLASYQFVD